MEIPNDLLCLFTAEIEVDNGSYSIDVPAREFEQGALDVDDHYRIAILPTSDGGQPTLSPEDPPVAVGDTREVEIEGIGDQGDGIARVDRGYVVIVPDTNVGDQVEIEIEETHENFALASVVDSGPEFI